MLSKLRRSGGSLVVTIPKAFTEQNKLGEGSLVELKFEGEELTVRARSRPRYKLSELLAEMPEGLPLVEGWDEMPSVGLEKS